MGDNYKAAAAVESLKRCCFIMTGNLGTTINDRFNDDMLLKILSCLPLKSAVACKSVCKRWLSLISTPSFVSCFVSNSRHQQQQQQQNDHLVLKPHWLYLFLTSEQIPNFDISFSFLLSSQVRILALSGDLFLCSRRLDQELTFIICNPFTKKWLQLPPPPPTTSTGQCFGFACEPYYRVEDIERVMVNSSCRFRVVRLNMGITQRFREAICAFEVNIFLSETWQWTTRMMHSPLKIRPARIISHNKLFFLMCLYGEVIVHDAYKDNLLYVIDTPLPPDEFIVPKPVLTFCSSEGSLMAFQYYLTETFRVWELEDWDQREWRLNTAIDVKEYLVNSSEMLEWAGDSKILVVAAHPNDKKVFFLWSRFAGVGTINLRTRLFSQLFNPASSRPVGRRHVLEYTNPSGFIPIKPPCWPTPISALLNQPPAPAED